MLTLSSPIEQSTKVLQRKGFPLLVPAVPELKDTFNAPSCLVPLVYWTSRLSHSGITSFKTFENVHRRVSNKSLANLLNISPALSETAGEVSPLEKTRRLSEAQSLKVKKLCSKLCYYSASREFTSKKSGKYRFKVAFLTLTAPDGVPEKKLLSAFEAFLSYLSRTANCTFVWKKELGTTGKHLHFHILVNNFVPYYIVEWKWRKLLIAQGVDWPVDTKGKPTSSHYRIELPKSAKHVGQYIAKYMSKAYELPKSFGYITGHSQVLTDCKDSDFIDLDLPSKEIQAIMSVSKVIRGAYYTHTCVDLLKVKEIAPTIGALFESQYMAFCQAITLPQKFHCV